MLCGDLPPVAPADSQNSHERLDLLITRHLVVCASNPVQRSTAPTVVDSSYPDPQSVPHLAPATAAACMLCRYRQHGQARVHSLPRQPRPHPWWH